MKKICLIGAGGFAKEVFCLLEDLNRADDVQCFMETNPLSSSVMGKPIKPISQFDDKNNKAIICVGDPEEKQIMLNQLSNTTEFETIIHPTAVISDWVTYGIGNIICAGAVITCNISFGDFNVVDRNSSIGHDCTLGDFVHLTPGVVISGNVTIGNNVYFGTNSVVKERINICSKVTIGLNSGVINDINKPGVYIGTPAIIIND